MPARASIVINDGKATPVAHTFSPSTEADNASLFEDRSGGVAIGFPSIMVRVRRPLPAKNGDASSANQRVYRIDTNIAVPTLESTSASTGTGIPPAPTVAYVHRCNMSWIIPERGTLADRKDLVAYASNLLANTNILSVLWNLEDYW